MIEEAFAGQHTRSSSSIGAAATFLGELLSHVNRSIQQDDHLDEPPPTAEDWQVLSEV
jgi:hypothetical protein